MLDDVGSVMLRVCGPVQNFFSRVPREENGVKVIVGWLGIDSIMHGVEEGMIGRIVGVGGWDELVLELELVSELDLHFQLKYFYQTYSRVIPYQ